MRYILPYTAILLIFISGAVVFFKSFSVAEGNFRFSKDVTRRRFYKLSKWYQKEFKNTQTDVILKQAGIRMSAFLYNTVRYSILSAWLMYMTYARLGLGINVNLQILTWLMIMIVTRPDLKLLNFKSPFYYLTLLLTKRVKDRSDVEIDNCFSQLKNLALSMSEKGKALSSDYIIREITKYTNVIRPHLIRLSGFWADMRYDEGQNYFANAIGTEAAKSLAAILSKLDFIEPEEFISQIEVYQNRVGEQRKTAVKKVRETQGVIVFLIALISGFIILINFLVVVVGIDTFSMFEKVSF